MLLLNSLPVTLPLVYHAFKETRYKLPVYSSENGVKKQVYKGDPKYDVALENSRYSIIENVFRDFLRKESIRDDLIIVKAHNRLVLRTQGTNIFRNADAAVLVTPGLYESDSDACSFLMKHEISHIKNNEAFNQHVIGAIIAIATFIFISITFPSLPPYPITFLLTFSVVILYSRLCEGRADSFAVEKSSDDELLGGRRFFLALKEGHQSVRLESQSTWKKMKLSPTGENRFDFIHPSISSRINKIEKTLQDRNITIDKIQEDEKIEKLKNFLFK